MTVEHVLAQHGHPLGHGGRTTCPVCHGTNPQSFRYDDDRFFCYACNESGDADWLRSRLRGARSQPRTALGGVETMPRAQDDAPKPGIPLSVRLRALARDRRRWRNLFLDELHHQAENGVRTAIGLLEIAGPEDEAMFDYVGAVVIQCYRLREWVDARTGCVCRF